MSNQPRKFATFDVDGTIFRSSLLIELVEELVEAGLFPIEARTDYRSPFHRWLDREDSYEKYIEAVVSVFTKNIKGVYC